MYNHSNDLFIFASEVEEYIFKAIYIDGSKQPEEDGTYVFNLKEMPYSFPADRTNRDYICKSIEERLKNDIKDADNYDSIVHQDEYEEDAIDDVAKSYSYSACVELDGDTLRVNV